MSSANGKVRRGKRTGHSRRRIADIDRDVRAKLEADREADRRQAAAELIEWWAAAAAELDRINKGVHRIVGAAEREGSPLNEMFANAWFDDIRRDVDNAAAALNCCALRLPRSAAADPIPAILKRLVA